MGHMSEAYGSKLPNNAKYGTDSAPAHNVFTIENTNIKNVT